MTMIRKRSTQCSFRPRVIPRKALVRAGLLALSLLPVPAFASHVDITVTGTVTSGTDTTGVFGAPGTSLAGQGYTATITLDDTAGTSSSSSCGGVLGASQITGGTSSSNPVVGGSISIGGGGWQFDGFPFGVVSSNYASRTIPTCGTRIQGNLDYSYLLTGMFSGTGTMFFNVTPPTGGTWTTDYNWEDAFTLGTLGTDTGSFSINRVISASPSTIYQEASGTLAQLTISVSGPYTPPSTTPPASTTYPPKNNGKPNVGGSPSCGGADQGNGMPSDTTANSGGPASMPGASTDNAASNMTPGALSPSGAVSGGFIVTSRKTCSGSLNTGTGNNVQIESDYVGAPQQQLSMTRVYNSFDQTTTSFGTGWHGTYNRSIAGPVSGVVAVTHQDGSVDNYTNTGGVWVPDADVTDTLTAVMSGGVQTGWQLVRSDDTTENYNIGGQLTSLVTRSGLVTSLTYTSGNLTTVTGPFGQTLTFTYDSLNRVLTMVTPNSDTYTYGYTNNDNLAAIKYPDATMKSYIYTISAYPHLLTGVYDAAYTLFTSFTYDSTGRVTSSQHTGGVDHNTITYNTGGTVTATDATSNSHTYTYQMLFNRVQPSTLTGDPYPAAGGAGFTYDSNGFIASRTDFNGNVTTYVHNALGEETSRTEADGTAIARTITTTWLTGFHLPTQITEPNRVTNFTYDTNGNMLTKTITAGTLTREWIYTYNTSGQVLTATDPNSNVTTFTYDTHGNVATIKDALLHTTSFTSYDTNGRLLHASDPNGLVYIFTYDKLGRMLTRSVGGFVTTYTWDANGNLTKALFPDASYLTYTYDSAHRLTKVTDRLGNYKTYTLDNAGDRTLVQVYNTGGTLKLKHSYTYDTVNRMATDSGAYTGETTTYGYDDQSNLLTITDPLSHVTTYTYDALNRRITSEDALSNTTSYGYNANDDLTSVEDPRSLTTTYAYDGLDNQTAVSSPDTGSTTRTFDNAGNVLTSTDARSDVTTYTYDALQRPHMVSYTSGTGITYTYDAGTYGLGHLTSMTDATGSTTWTYNQYGNVLSKAQTTGTVTRTVSYQYYNSNNRLEYITYPSGKYTTLSYDNDGHISTITIASTTVANSVTYQPFGTAASWTQRDSATYTRAFDQDNRITSVANGTLNTQTLAWDTASRLTGLTETGLSAKTYGYDDANRLTSFVNGTATTSYAYDDDDNRSSVTTAAGTVTYNYPGTSNQLTSLSGLISQTNTFDAAGNQTGDGTNAWTYNARGRMAQDATTSATTTYGVNGLGERVTKTSTAISSGANLYVYDEAGRMLGEYTATGTPIQETVYLGDTPIATLQGATPTLYAIASDWQNTPHIITNSSATAAWSWDRFAFGDNAPNTNPGGLGTFTYNPRFPGQLADSESGTNDNGFRTYNPNAGRYIQSDPVGLGSGINTYGYVNEDPMRLVDPRGMNSFPPTEWTQSPYSLPPSDPAKDEFKKWWDQQNKPQLLCDLTISKPCAYVLKRPLPFYAKAPMWAACEASTTYLCSVVFANKQPEVQPEKSCPISQSGLATTGSESTSIKTDSQ